MSFIRRREEALALRYIVWQYQKQGISLPNEALLNQKAVQIVEEAHRIARERGKNIFDILKELAADFIKK